MNAFGSAFRRRLGSLKVLLFTGGVLALGLMQINSAWGVKRFYEKQKLLASDGTADNIFGYSLSVSEDVAIVGAPWDDDKGEFTGSAYIFHWNGSNWIEEQKLQASDGAAYDELGCSVSVSGDAAIVGATSGSQGAYGAAYIFDVNTNYGDLNGDGVIDRADTSIIRSHMNQPASVCPECDINDDGTINILDARELLLLCTNAGCR
jgi:hypothetical protein